MSARATLAGLDQKLDLFRPGGPLNELSATARRMQRAQCLIFDSPDDPNILQVRARLRAARHRSSNDVLSAVDWAFLPSVIWQHQQDDENSVALVRQCGEHLERQDGARGLLRLITSYLRDFEPGRRDQAEAARWISTILNRSQHPALDIWRDLHQLLGLFEPGAGIAMTTRAAVDQPEAFSRFTDILASAEARAGRWKFVDAVTRRLCVWVADLARHAGTSDQEMSNVLGVLTAQIGEEKRGSDWSVLDYLLSPWLEDPFCDGRPRLPLLDFVLKVLDEEAESDLSPETIELVERWKADFACTLFFDSTLVGGSTANDADLATEVRQRLHGGTILRARLLATRRLVRAMPGLPPGTSPAVLRPLPLQLAWSRPRSSTARAALILEGRRNIAVLLSSKQLYGPWTLSDPIASLRDADEVPRTLIIDDHRYLTPFHLLKSRNRSIIEGLDRLFP